MKKLILAVLAILAVLVLALDIADAGPGRALPPDPESKQVTPKGLAPTPKPARRCPPTCHHKRAVAATDESEKQAPCPVTPKPCRPTSQGVASASNDCLPDLPTRGDSRQRSVPSGWQSLVESFELTAGFRWEPEHECPTLLVPTPPPPRVVDPFYLGFGIRLPLTEHVDAFGEFDRDWTEAPDFQIRTGIHVRPWARAR